MAPVHGRSQGPLAGHHDPATVREQEETVVEARGDLGWRKHRVLAAASSIASGIPSNLADARHVGDVLRGKGEAGRRRRGPLHEEAHRLVERRLFGLRHAPGGPAARADRPRPLGGDAKRLGWSRRSSTRAASEQRVGEPGAGRERRSQLSSTRSVSLGPRWLDRASVAESPAPQRTPRARAVTSGTESFVGDRGQLDPEDAVTETPRQFGGRQRKPRLAAAPRAGERKQPTGGQQRLYLGQLPLAPDAAASNGGLPGGSSRVASRSINALSGTNTGLSLTLRATRSTRGRVPCILRIEKRLRVTQMSDLLRAGKKTRCGGSFVGSAILRLLLHPASAQRPSGTASYGPRILSARCALRASLVSTSPTASPRAACQHFGTLLDAFFGKVLTRPDCAGPRTRRGWGAARRVPSRPSPRRRGR